jgi:hypothetical protein
MSLKTVTSLGPAVIMNEVIPLSPMYEEIKPETPRVSAIAAARAPSRVVSTGSCQYTDALCGDGGSAVSRRIVEHAGVGEGGMGVEGGAQADAMKVVIAARNRTFM